MGSFQNMFHLKWRLPNGSGMLKPEQADGSEGDPS
jgi:hypothetical protein